MAYDDVFVNDSLLEVDTLVKSFNGQSYINLNNSFGYVMLEDADIDIKRQINNKTAFFTVRLNHGKRPENAAYAYAMLPGATNEETKSFYENPSVEILSNTESLHAVKDLESGYTGANFFEAGEISGIQVKTPCAIMFKYESGVYDMYVSDPAMTQREIVIEFPTDVTVAGENAEVTLSGREVFIDVSPYFGASYHITVTEK